MNAKTALLLLIALGAPAFGRIPQTKPTTVRILPTGSMLPLLKGGEVLAVKQVRWEDLKVGDICLYWNRQVRGDVPVLHRLQFFRSSDRAVMKGDNNLWNDPGYMTPGDLLGVVVLAEGKR